MLVGEDETREFTLEAEKLNQESLEHTREFCFKRLGKELTLEDARQIRESLVKFFKLLKKWDRESKKRKLTENET